MCKQLLAVLSIWLSVSLCAARAQNFTILYQNPSQLAVCSADTLRVTVLNNTAAPVTGALLDLELPAGLEYVPGSATGAAEANIGDLQKPVLALPALPPGIPVPLRVHLSATCGLADAINSAQLFHALLRVRAGALSEQLTTTAFQIQTSLLVITQVDNDSVAGEKGQTFVRTLHVRNTRLGAVKHMFLRDAHPAGISIEAAGASNGQNTATLCTATFDGAFFSQFGDGDTLLEFGETVLIRETITITDCGTPSYTCRSAISTAWSCHADTPSCQADSTHADVLILPSTFEPELIFQPHYALPWDRCAQTPAEMSVRVINKGSAPATNIFLQIRSNAPDHLGMDKTSFRLLHHGTAQPLVPNLTSDNPMGDCGVLKSGNVTLYIPELAAQDTMDLLFHTYSCDDPCKQHLPKLRLNYYYNKPCPIGSFVTRDTVVFEAKPQNYLSAGVSFFLNDCLSDGGKYPFSYNLISSRLLSDTGYLWLRFNLPIGLEWSDDCPPVIEGVAPVHFSSHATNTGLPVNQVLAAFPLPLPDDTLNMEFCLRSTCRDDASFVLQRNGSPDADGNFVVYEPTCKDCGFQVETAALLSLSADPGQLDCAISACDSFYLRTDCPCPADTLNGSQVCDIFLSREYRQAYRLNLGLPDNDNNRKADITGVVDTVKIRRDRLLPGDTLRNILSTKIVAGHDINRLFYQLFTEVIRSDFGYAGVFDTFNIGPSQGDAARYVFTNKKWLRVVGANLKVWDSSANAMYQCPLSPVLFLGTDEQLYGQIARVNTQPTSIVDELTTMNYAFLPDMELLSQQGYLPPGLRLETGDSVALTVDLHFGFNYAPECKQHSPPLINFEMGYNANRPYRFYNYRYRDTLMFQYSGFRDTLEKTTFGIKPCENSAQVKPFEYRIRIARENLFPYEVRPLAKIKRFVLSIPEGITPLSARVDYIRLQENVPVFLNTAVPFSVKDTFLMLDFTPVFRALDEGYALRTRIVFAPTCDFTKPDSSTLWVTLDFPGTMIPFDTVQYVLGSKIGYYANVPLDTIVTDETVLDFPTPVVSADIQLINEATVPAPNYWIRLVNPEGGLTDLGLQIQGASTGITPQNDFFRLGALPILGKKDLRITARNTTCEPQHLLVIYGWECQMHLRPDTASCNLDTLELLFRPLNPELELDLGGAPVNIPLCDTSDYFLFEIFNADLGYAYKPFASLELPPGVHLLPGSCEMAYPSGSAFAPIPDPAAAGNNVLEWNIAALKASLGADGLPGVDRSPLNAFQIRFKVMAECGVVSNAQVVLGARAEWSCGKPTNTLRKASPPIAVDGIAPAYTVNAGLSAPGGGMALCNTEHTLAVSLLLSGTALPGDSIYVTLPQGYSYVQGSYQAGSNALPGDPQVQGSLLRWPLPSGMPANTVVAFNFRVLTPPTPQCTDATVQVQTRQRSSGYCPAIQDYCAIYVATGSASYTFPATDPALSVVSAQLTNTAGGMTDLHIVLENQSPFPLPKPVIYLYHDVDGNGSLSAPDTAVFHTALGDQVPSSGTDSIGLAGIFANQEICQWLLVLFGADNCDCQDLVYPLQQNPSAFAALNMCMGDSIAIGVLAESGHSYTWDNAPGLTCPECPQTGFHPASPGLYSLVLTDLGPSCAIERHFAVQVRESPALLNRDTALCRGSALTLAASGAVSWQWSGPDGLSAATAVWEVESAPEGTYAVTATNAAGCTLDAQIQVSWLVSDTTDLGTLSTCAGTPVDVFGKPTDVPGLYTLRLPDAAGCDSIVQLTLVVKPKLNTQETRLRCVRDTLVLFGQTVTAAGTYCGTFTSSQGCDSTHCIVVTDLPAPEVPDPDTIYIPYGGSTTLEGPPGFATYSWAPSDYLSCANCPSPVATPPDTITYVLTISTSDGCTDTVVYRVVPFPPCDIVRLKVPNAFTPDGDGINDMFTVVPYEGSEIIRRLTIYNRWGQKVYESSGPQAAWDGTTDGEPAPSDVYVWILEVACDGVRQKPRVGDVAVMR